MKKYTIETTKNIHDFHFATLSDIHATEKLDLKKWKVFYNTIFSSQPKFICFLGDTVNDAQIDKSFCTDFLEPVASLARSKQIPTYFILGNHDQLTYDGKKYIPCPEANSNFLKTLRLFPSLTLLQNQRVSLDSIHITGLSQDGSFYVTSKENEKMFKEICNREMPEEQSPNTYNIILNHTANPYTEEGLKDNYAFQNADLVLSGHLHNGMIPTYIDSFLQKIHIPNRGLIGIKGDQLLLFPKRARGLYSIRDQTIGITTSPIQTFGEEKKLHFLNALYPSHIHSIYVKRK